MSAPRKVAALVDEAMESAAKALIANRPLCKSVIWVNQDEENRIDYRFGVTVPLEGDDLAKMTAAFETVTRVIEQDCHMHIVRVAPLLQTEKDFESNTVWVQGYMRGHMIGIGVGVGPATRSAPPPTERVVMSAGT